MNPRSHLAANMRHLERLDALSLTRALTRSESLRLELAMRRVEYFKTIRPGSYKKSKSQVFGEINKEVGSGHA